MSYLDAVGRLLYNKNLIFRHPYLIYNIILFLFIIPNINIYYFTHIILLDIIIIYI